MLRPDDTVKLNPAVLEDASLKTNHHLLSRIMREEMTGVIREQDMEKSTPQAFYYWVSFYYGAFLLSEFHLMKVAEATPLTAPPAAPPAPKGEEHLTPAHPQPLKGSKASAQSALI